jgi:hypothetical protein
VAPEQRVDGYPDVALPTLCPAIDIAQLERAYAAGA